MDMDDPWGSPWADEIQSIPSNKPSVKEELAEPNTPAPEQQTNASLWDGTGADNNDLGFGNWADTPAEGNSGLNGTHDSWVGGLENKADIKLPKRETNAFPILWDDEPLSQEYQASYPAPQLLPSTTEVVRHPSPDPWGFQAGESLQKDILTTVRDEPDDDTQSSEATIIIDSKEDFKEEQAPSCAIELLPGEATEQLSPISDHEHMGDHTIEQPEDAKKDASYISPATAQETSAASKYVDRTSPMTSSSPSDASHLDELFVESPRTSLDDEPKRPQMPRQVSKVQELVEHFDTLAKNDDTIELEECRQTSSLEGCVNDLNDSIKEKQEENGSDDDNDDFGDFGDFEESRSVVGEPVTEQTPPITAATSITTNPNMDATELGEALPQKQAKVDHGPLNFNPNADVTTLEKIFPDLQEIPVIERCFVPDVVPHDSFISAEERKLWYRISRYGPMRQHNSGDDENYVRVNWRRSAVRDDTLNIVARWIEEDRISGRVVLGGGSKAGSIFGWNDPNAKPASIAAAFAERHPRKKISPVPVAPVVEVPREWPKGLVREPSTSKGSSSSKGRRKSSTKSISSLEGVIAGKASPATPGANFGWNSEVTPETSNTSLSRPQSAHRKSGSITSIVMESKPPVATQNGLPRTMHSSANSGSKPGDFNSQSALSAPQLDTIFSPPLVKPDIPASVAVHSADGIEDDWGEMISSPVTAVAPILPLSSDLHHKKSRSLGPGSLPKEFEPVGRASYDRNRQPTASLVEGLMPESHSSRIVSPLVPTSTTNFSASSSQPLQPTTGTLGAQPINSDAWASADFSFFDTAPASVPIPAPHSKPITKVIPTKGVSFTSFTATASSPSPITPITRRSREELEQDRIVESVLKSLPDFSHMLKR